jgi:hypothetical protein
MTNTEWVAYLKKIVDFYTEKREVWSKTLDDLNKLLKHTSISNLEDIIHAEALALSYRHLLADEIADFSISKRKLEAELKTLFVQKSLSYINPGPEVPMQVRTAISSKVITTKQLLADDLKYHEQDVLMLEEHIGYLKMIREDLESYAFTIKNRIEFLKIKAGL